MRYKMDKTVLDKIAQAESMKNIIFLIFLVIIIVILGIILITISKSFKKSVQKDWAGFLLLNHNNFHFFLAKTAAYRRILYFFTCLSYGLRIFSVLTTFFIIYCLIDDSTLSNALLVFSALCDGINLLFPFQKFVDAFSTCCINMENCILESEAKLIQNENVSVSLLYQIYNEFTKKYNECEDLLHIQIRI